MNDEQFDRLKGRLEQLLGLDLDAYKQAQMRRRVTTHIAKVSGDVDGFIEALGSDPDELTELRDMITINVTEFFRDQSQWQQLRETVLPEVIESARGAPSVWSAGCSTGQEPYSIAMLLAQAGVLGRTTILATDFDREVLAKARSGGPYTADEIKGISNVELDTYFEEQDGKYTASQELKSRIRFRELNLLKDRFGRGYDLVVCRNVMIYFTAEVKSALVARFLESLRPGGVLFIGATEALLGADLDQVERMGGNFYRKRASNAAKAA
jgi:chemotaxis protein methyltransferase CheR